MNPARTVVLKTTSHGTTMVMGTALDVVDGSRGMVWRSREDDTLQSEFIQAEPRYIKSRGLSEDTCKKFGYGVGEYKGTLCHVANYRDDQGKIVAQKIRMPGKDFRMIGKPTALYGEHLWRDGGKFITVTEGEIDALSVSQAFGNKWPVVSIPTGAKGATKAISRSIEFLEVRCSSSVL